jgi:feruloyl esterase
MKDVNEGFAVPGGDGGHRASDNNNGVGGFGVKLPFLQDKNQILAWIRNSVAFLTPPAKSMVETYYGEKPKKTYYIGCSDS